MKIRGIFDYSSWTKVLYEDNTTELKYNADTNSSVVIDTLLTEIRTPYKTPKPSRRNAKGGLTWTFPKEDIREDLCVFLASCAVTEHDVLEKITVHKKADQKVNIEIQYRHAADEVIVINLHTHADLSLAPHTERPFLQQQVMSLRSQSTYRVPENYQEIDESNCAQHGWRKKSIFFHSQDDSPTEDPIALSRYTDYISLLSSDIRTKNPRKQFLGDIDDHRQYSPKKK